MKVIDIDIELFNSHGFVFYGCTPKEVADYCDKKLVVPKWLPKELRSYEDDDLPQGMTLSNAKRSANWVIWLSFDPNKSIGGKEVLSHEATHAALAMLKHWSIDPSNDGEITAMLVGYIVKKVFAYKKKK